MAGQIALGLGLGLVLTELAFAARDRHAFPHVNFYVPDAELGARLEPGAEMKFRLGNNPLTNISVNSHGYRGPEWPTEPSEGEILVVGDSQVFGLGVDDDQTFSAELSRALDRTVLNAGVPTYGPPEYLATARALLDERPSIGTLVYVLNFLNDPFELARPNHERHAIWDGWAVQIETAPRPEDIVEFPGRRWLMSRSHTVYAARRWWHSSDAAWFARVDQGLPSEGAWSDLLATSELTPTAIGQAELEATLLIVDAETRVQKLLARLAELDEDLDRARRDLERNPRRSHDDQILEARPGEIIRDRYSESARSIEVTAEVYKAALDRRREHLDARSRLDSLETQREQLLADIGGVRVPSRPDSPPTPARAPSVFETHFVELQRLCERHDVDLLVVMLPFDVQVSSDEWLKYGVEDGPDMTPTLALIDDAMASAANFGIATLDATPILREALPGAFLDADIHMTPKGHAALGQALAEWFVQSAGRP